VLLPTPPFEFPKMTVLGLAVDLSAWPEIIFTTSVFT